MNKVVEERDMLKSDYKEQKGEVQRLKESEKTLFILEDQLVMAKQKLGDIYNTAIQLGGIELFEKLQNS